MSQFVGKPIQRSEDARLLTGQALFVDDVHLPRMAHVAFLRSPYAHARINGIDTSAAEELEGVIAVHTAESLGEYWKQGPFLVSPPPIERLTFNEKTQPILAKDKARHVGEPLAVVVAESRYIAEDALQRIKVDYEPLPAVVDLEAALESETVPVHEDLETNLASHVVQEIGDYESIREKADVIIRRRFTYDHGAAAAMENRGIVADWDAKAQRMTVWDTTQAPIPIRNGLAGMLGLSEHQVRVIAPFIGGGFGPKIMMFYPEEMMLPWLSMRYNRPMKWIEDRTENFVATTNERAQIHEAELAISKDGKILGVHDRFLHDTGAYDPYGLTVPINSQCTLLGCYEIPNYFSEFKMIFTNKTIVTPYRGAGRQHGVFVMERLLDLAAAELGMDPVEIRRRNLISPDAFPKDNKIIYQDFTPLIYDSGNYGPVLEQALEKIEYNKFIEDEQPKLRAEGRKVGIGVVTYVEGTGIGPYEGARVQIQPSGKISVVTGVGTQGQGHFTAYAQIVAEQLGTDLSDIDVVTGDTDQFHWGTGTFASRGTVVAGNAINEAAKDVRAKVLNRASELFEVEESALQLEGGKVFVKDQAEKSIGLGELAAQANPLRGAVKPGSEPGLEATNYFGPATGATASGAHAMIVEVDPETFNIEILKYVAIHDAGRIINPLLVDGQVQGGIAQGIGNAFYEQLIYDENGQLLNGTFMDYLLPTSLDVPNIIIGHEETPSPLNPLGVKGAGEAGAIPVGPLFCQAIENALDIEGLELLDIPLSPGRLWEAVQRVQNK